MDVRGPTVWSVEGSDVAIEKTFFQAIGEDLSFHVVWNCPDCFTSADVTPEEVLAVSRPVLRYAVQSGELSRVAVHEYGGGGMKVNHLVSTVQYEIDGEPRSSGVSVEQLDVLYQWTWDIDGHSYHVFGPGYYHDTQAGELYFTIRWHAPELCGPLSSITDEEAASLAMPIMKKVLSQELYKQVPQVGPSGAEPGPPNVDKVGVEIGCPDPNCDGSPDCKVRGYRVARSPAEIAAAP